MCCLVPVVGVVRGLFALVVVGCRNASLCDVGCGCLVMALLSLVLCVSVFVC